METVCFSETLASTDESTRRQNPEDHHPHRHENLRSHNTCYVFFVVETEFLNIIYINFVLQRVKTYVQRNEEYFSGRAVSVTDNLRLNEHLGRRLKFCAEHRNLCAILSFF
jgi:hypothetical protein